MRHTVSTAVKVRVSGVKQSFDLRVRKSSLEENSMETKFRVY